MEKAVAGRNCFFIIFFLNVFIISVKSVSNITFINFDFSKINVTLYQY